MTVQLALGAALVTLIFAFPCFAFTSTRNLEFKSLVLATIGTAALWATNLGVAPFDSLLSAATALVVIFGVKYAVAKMTGETLVMLQTRANN